MELPSVGTIISAIRKRKNLSQEAVALRGGPPLTRVYVSQLERDKVRNPTRQTLAALAKGLAEAPMIFFESGLGTVSSDSEPERTSIDLSGVPSVRSKFVMAVMARQAQTGLSGNALSRKLGVNPSVLSRVLSGKREPGMAFIRGVVRLWPEIGSYLLIDLAESGRRATERQKKAYEEYVQARASFAEEADKHSNTRLTAEVATRLESISKEVERKRLVWIDSSRV
jgi:transcriptional regulator with XRE-family HTH domain